MKLTETLADLLEGRVKYLKSKINNWKNLEKAVGVSRSQLNKIYNGKHRTQNFVRDSICEKITAAYNRHCKVNAKNMHSENAKDILKDVQSIKVVTDHVSESGEVVETTEKVLVRNNDKFIEPNGIFHEHPVVTPDVFNSIEQAYKAKQDIIRILGEYAVAVQKLRSAGAKELIAHDDSAGVIHLINVEFSLKV